MYWRNCALRCVQFVEGVWAALSRSLITWLSASQMVSAAWNWLRSASDARANRCANEFRNCASSARGMAILWSSDAKILSPCVETKFDKSPEGGPGGVGVGEGTYSFFFFFLERAKASCDVMGSATMAARKRKMTVFVFMSGQRQRFFPSLPDLHKPKTSKHVP
jgi:hypothetical protein